MAESKQEYDLLYFNGMTKMLEVERNKVHLVHSYFYHFYMAYQRFFEKTGGSLNTIVRLLHHLHKLAHRTSPPLDELPQVPEMQIWKEAIEAVPQRIVHRPRLLFFFFFALTHIRDDRRGRGHEPRPRRTTTSCSTTSQSCSR